MSDVVINELNAVLKGEEMAIEAYDKFIQDVKDENIKKEFQQIQREHKMHSSELAQRIHTLGGIPQYGTGIGGVMFNAKHFIQENIQEKSTLELLKQAYDGEDKGIAKVEEIIKGDLDSESMKLVKNILSNDHDHLKRMVNLMSSINGTKQ